jgi:hypothetical protein
VPHRAFCKENEGGKGKFVLKITTALNIKFKQFSCKMSSFSTLRPKKIREICFNAQRTPQTCLNAKLIFLPTAFFQ